MLAFDLLELLKELVVLRVGQLRLVEHVVRVVRTFELFAQPQRAPGRSVRRGGAGGTGGRGSSHAVRVFADKGQTPDYLGKRRAGHRPNGQFRAYADPRMQATRTPHAEASIFPGRS